jgi:hypothetical protein
VPDWGDEYRAMFDAFVYERNLDIENDNWPEQDEADWDALVADFNQRTKGARR